MIVLDGMPGTGKTTLLKRLRTALPHHLVVFPEAQPPKDSSSDAETARLLLGKARGRIDAARHLARTRPEVIVTSDRGHIGVLAYRYALAATGRAPHSDFEHALSLCRDLDLIHPRPDVTTLVLLTDPDTSITRRAAYAHDERYRQWFDHGFLTAYRDFLDNLQVWLPTNTFTSLDVTDTSGWPALLDALPHHLARQVPSEEALTRRSEAI
ncbi:AAA family ATPase [Streptomyces sp. NPDC059373]